jgi:hypothetical protein
LEFFHVDLVFAILVETVLFGICCLIVVGISKRIPVLLVAGAENIEHLFGMNMLIDIKSI